MKNFLLFALCAVLSCGCGKMKRTPPPQEYERIVCMSSTQAALLDALGEAHRIVGLSGLRYLTNREIATSAAEVGYDHLVDYERLVALQPDVVLLYGIEGAHPAEAKLRELGIPYVYTKEHKESSPLGKARWLIEAGRWVGKEADAEAQYVAIEERYDALKLLTEGVDERPRVMVNVPYGDAWFLPGEDNYVSQLIRDAGGMPVWEATPGAHAVPIDMEEAYRLAWSADVWIHTDRVETLNELSRTLPNFAQTPVVRSGRIYNNTRRANAGGGNDFWESGTVRADVVLEDLIKILHPEILNGELYYYRKLG